MSTTQNIIFTSIDGVLNDQLSRFIVNRMNQYHAVSTDVASLFERLVERLVVSSDAASLFEHLLIITDSKFVVTGWTNTDPFDDQVYDLFHPNNSRIGDALSKAGFTDWKKYVLGGGVTPKLQSDDLRTKLLGLEISSWMKENRYDDSNSKFCIIDDDYSDLNADQLDNLVLTNRDVGLTIHHIRQAARILGKSL